MIRAIVQQQDGLWLNWSIDGKKRGGR